MRNKRGVSPIIATILLVAITVVLAAVLYILISGLTRGPGSTPIGSAFGMGSPVREKGTGSTPGCASGNTCYTVAIASAGGGITWTSVIFVVHDANGNPVTLGVGNGIKAIGSNGATVSTCAIGTACVIGTGPATIGTNETIVLDTGGTTALTGDTLVADGTGSYSSSTFISLP